MLSKRTLHGGSSRLAALIAATLLSTILATGTASAQTLSLWPGDWLAELTESGTQTASTVSFPDHIAPGQIVASFSDRRLYYVYTRGRAVSYPIATPRRQSRWQGVMRISRKKINPSWTPTASMRAENPHLPAYVPGGHPKNPLGKRALYLGSSLYRIHGTDAPWTIGQPVSKGCIRMHNHDVMDLYRRVGVGTKVTVTWKSFS